MGTDRVLTVEDLNPRSRAVTSIVSTIKRAVLLIELVRGIASLVGDEYVIDNPPQALGGTFASKAKRIWGDSWRSHPELRHWQYLVSVVESGSLDRQIEAALQSLPSRVRKKLMKEIGR